MTVVVRFTIQRDGRLTDATVDRSSGYSALDQAAATRRPGDAAADSAARGVYESDAHRVPQFSVSTMKQHISLRALKSCATVALVVALSLTAGARPQTPPPPQQPSQVSTTINGNSGEAPRFAVPAFIALSGDAETAAVARTIGDTLWDDLNFEREFLFIPRDIYATIPAAKSFDDIAFDRWRELNTDGVIAGTVLKTGAGFQIQVRLFDVKTRKQVFGKDTAARRTPGCTRTPFPTTSTCMLAKANDGQIYGYEIQRQTLEFNMDNDELHRDALIEERDAIRWTIRDQEQAAVNGWSVLDQIKSLNCEPLEIEEKPAPISFADLDERARDDAAAAIRLAELDNLSPACEWELPEVALPESAKAARVQWDEIMELQNAYEAKYNA